MAEQAGPAPSVGKKKVTTPEEPPPTPSDAERPLLSSSARIDADEMYGKDERLLNEFLKRHPMLSLEVTSAKVLQVVGSMTEKASIAVPELPVVGKKHDDLFLQPPNVAIGERECVLGERCICIFIARLRYGAENEFGFTCKEYLLPGQHASFLKGGGLPKNRGKCLVCSRYYLNYLYLICRTDPSFRLPNGVVAQTFSNPTASLPEHEEIVSATADLPTHCSPVSCSDGYRPSALLFVDEGFAQNRVQRESKLTALSFRPVVRFSSTHYRYVKDIDGSKRVVQVNVGMENEEIEGLGFQRRAC